MRLELRVVLQSIVELCLLVVKLGYLSLEVLDVLSCTRSADALRFSIVCAFPQTLICREGSDTSRRYLTLGKCLRFTQVACSFLLPTTLL
jgi:hypothetical protein